MTAVRNIVRGVVRPVVRGVTEGVGIISAPGVVYDGNTPAWFDYLERFTKDSSNFVSVWGDKSGNSNDLLQATGTNQPLWTPNGVLFDGIDNFMKCVAFTLVRPEMIYIVFKQITWTNFDYIFDGNAGDSGTLLQFGTSNSINLANGGTPSPENKNLALDTFGIVRCLLIPAVSEITINETTPLIGNFGTANMGGFTLGGKADGTQWSHIQVKEIIIRKIADTSEDEQLIYDYLKSKYGIS